MGGLQMCIGHYENGAEIASHSSTLHVALSQLLLCLDTLCPDEKPSTEYGKSTSVWHAG